MVDALCYDDLDAYGRELDDPVAELEQDLYHRVIEPPGSNPDDEDRGLGVEDMLSGQADPSLASRAEQEMLKDDRVDACNATLTQTSGTGNQGAGYELDIEIEPEGDISIFLPTGGV